MGKWTHGLYQVWTESQNGKEDTWFVPGVNWITEWESGHLVWARCGLNHRMGKWTHGLYQVWTESQNGKVDTWFEPDVDWITEWESGHLVCARCGL